MRRSLGPSWTREANKCHGQGTFTVAKSGKVSKGRFENGKFMG